MSHMIEEKNRVVRHGWIELAGHWTIALSGLALLLSGMFELPMAARFGITKLPGFGWSGNFITSLYVHYIASVIFVAAAFFHLVYHGLLKERGLLPRKGDLKASVEVVKSFFGFGEEPPFGKYLPEQRVAYLGMAIVIAVLVLTGLIKTYKNIYAPDLAHSVVVWSTTLHNLFFVLFILAFVGHIGALILKPNRPMVRGILTGKVRLDYAKQRHPLWIAGMNPPGSLPTTVKPDGVISLTPPPVEAASPDGENGKVEPLAASEANDIAIPQDAVTSATPETDRENGGDHQSSNPPAA